MARAFVLAIGCILKNGNLCFQMTEEAALEDKELNEELESTSSVEDEASST